MPVHNHGSEDGPGLRCNEVKLPDGTLRGVCLLTPEDLESFAKAKADQRTLGPEGIARDAIVQYLGSVPVIRMEAQHAARAFGDTVDSAYLAGAALRLGSISHESLLALITRAIEMDRGAVDVEMAWADHCIGFTWETEEQRYAEYRAFRAGFAARHA